MVLKAMVSVSMACSLALISAVLPVPANHHHSPQAMCLASARHASFPTLMAAMHGISTMSQPKYSVCIKDVLSHPHSTTRCALARMSDAA